MSILESGKASGGQKVEEDDTSDSVPSFQNSFSDALLNASQSIRAATRGLLRDRILKIKFSLFIFSDPGGKPGGSKTAKKACKKLVLFSTGGQRRL